MRLTDTTVEIFYKNERIASHRRLAGRPGQYATVQAHMLVDIEYSKRKDNRLKRLIKKAEFEQPDATIAGINYGAGRKLNRDLIDRLSTCEYISEYRNIFIIGAAGSGKTYLACAFGLAACMHYYKVRFVRLPDLLIELMPLVGNDAFAKAIKQYTNPRLLIIDEWLLTPLNDDEAKIVFEVIHKRRKKSSTIFCSQFLDEGWYERIGSEDNPLADSIMDRIKYDAYKIKIQVLILIMTDPCVKYMVSAQKKLSNEGLAMHFLGGHSDLPAASPPLKLYGG